ncbi:hypothetical protein E4U54_008693 [Claviceps lovelessii]|nr:hypothetical protein E4U54_008693 [Claviceps lovelessii]
MNRGYDGSIELDLGRLGGVSEGLVVTYEKNGKVVGRSMPRQRSGDVASLECRVLEARNTIFSQELWHELVREARTLAAYDVKLDGSRLTYQVDDSSRIILELVALESCPVVDETLLPDHDDSDGHGSNAHDADKHRKNYYSNMAETISLSLHILLCYAHRYNELMRTRPVPPHISRTRGQQVYALLRPVIARMTSVRSIRTCTEFVGNITKALQHAGFSCSSFILKTGPYSVVDATATTTTAATMTATTTTTTTKTTTTTTTTTNTTKTHGSNQPASSQSLVRSTLQPIEFNINWTILPDISLTIRSRTFLFPVTTTFYHIVLPPSSPLRSLCPPFADGYVDTRGLFDYIRTATARVLALHFLNKLCVPAADDADGPPPTKWIQTPHDASIRPSPSDPHEMHFSVADAPLTLLLSSTVSPRNDGGDGGDAETTIADASWKWTALESSSESRTMDDVVARCAASMA